jgi:4-diphosphocytidyl-2-C-methyl-D-erythritol kinase
MLKVRAPAKINLTLEVLGKRGDGYHDIRSVVQAIDLCDVLSFKKGEGISFEADIAEWSAEKSLLSKTVSLLQEATGCKKGAEIRLEKRIPMMAGLGGDSSDAAALLKGLNKLWSLKLSAEKLNELAAKAGSDVSFFIKGGTALMEGRGEKITALAGLPKMWVVLVTPEMPNAPGKTGRMYAALKAGHFTDGKMTQKAIEALHNNTFDTGMVYNVFENVADEHYMGLEKYQAQMKKLGAPQVHLAGSGPTLFSLFQDKNKASEFYKGCEGQGMKAFLATTM